jgi:hypothetical protein
MPIDRETHMTDQTDAKPRRRKPWYRPRNIILAAVLIVVLIVAWLFREVWKVYTDEPGADVDYRAQLTSLCASRQPEGENGWPALASVLERLDAAAEEAKRPLRLAEADWDVIEAAGLDAMRMLLYEDGLLEELRIALDKPRFVRSWRDDGMLMDELLPLLSPGRQLATLLSERMRQGAREERWGDVLDSFRMGMRLGEVTARQPSGVHYMSGVAIQGCVLSEARHMMRECDAPVALAAEIGAIVATHVPPPVAYHLEVGRLSTHDIMQWMHGMCGYALPLVTLFEKQPVTGGFAMMTPVHPVNDERSLLRAEAARFYLATRAENEALVDRWFAAQAAEAKAPFAARWSTFPPTPLASEIQDPKHAILAYFLAPLNRLIDAADFARMNRDATRLMAAIEQHEAEHGRPPDALADLSPAYLLELPTDPLHGGPFGYRPLHDDPYGRSYLLYSYGPDGVDDGGTPPIPPSSVDRSTCPVGMDIILNPPRGEDTDPN